MEQVAQAVNDELVASLDYTTSWLRGTRTTSNPENRCNIFRVP